LLVLEVSALQLIPEIAFYKFLAGHPINQ
jgi:hypothetical protein